MDRPTPPGQQQHCDSVEASHWSRSLESDATIPADYALTTTTTTTTTTTKLGALIENLAADVSGRQERQSLDITKVEELIFSEENAHTILITNFIAFLAVKNKLK